MGDDFN